MANPAWPSSLPQTPYDGINQYPQYAPIDNAVRTSVDVGPPKDRRRFTAVFEPVTIQLNLSSADVETLETFKSTTLQEVNAFDWIDFVTGDAASYKFAGPITKQYYGGDYWTVTIPLRKLP